MPPVTGWPSYSSQALGSLFIAFYDSQGYGRGTLTCIQMGWKWWWWNDFFGEQVLMKWMMEKFFVSTCQGKQLKHSSTYIWRTD
jgi:hypothetical protein